MTKHYEQRKAANERYLAKFERITYRVEPELKDKIKTHADIYDDGSVNAFITRAILETMSRDKKKTEG